MADVRLTERIVEGPIEWNRLLNALKEVIQPNRLDAWFNRPNKQFNGSTPAELIERGETDRIWRMISQLRDGNSG